MVDGAQRREVGGRGVEESETANWRGERGTASPKKPLPIQRSMKTALVVVMCL